MLAEDHRIVLSTGLGAAVGHQEAVDAMLAEFPSTEADRPVGVARFDTRLDAVDARLDGFDAQLDGVTGRLDRVETRLDGVDARLDRVDTRLVGLEAMSIAHTARLDGIDATLGRLGDLIERRMDRVDTRMSDMHASFVKDLNAMGLTLVRWLVTSLFLSVVAAIFATRFG